MEKSSNSAEKMLSAMSKKKRTKEPYRCTGNRLARPQMRGKTQSSKNRRLTVGKPARQSTHAKLLQRPPASAEQGTYRPKDARCARKQVNRAPRPTLRRWQGFECGHEAKRTCRNNCRKHANRSPSRPSSHVGMIILRPRATVIETS